MGICAGSIDPEGSIGEGVAVVMAEEIGEDVLAGNVEIWIRRSNDHVGDGCLRMNGQKVGRIEVGVRQRVSRSGLLHSWKRE